jgi:hypothetical protein
MSLPAPNAINCFECGEVSLVEDPTPDTGCPFCMDDGLEDVWCYEVCTVVPCPDTSDCQSNFCNNRGTHCIGVDEAEDALEGRDYGKKVLLPARQRPCRECPWRKNSAAGWLGPYSAPEWVMLAHSDEPVACHMTIEVDQVWTSRTQQCAGAAAYRAAVGKRSRYEDVATGPARADCFASRQDFLSHHLREESHG